MAELCHTLARAVVVQMAAVAVLVLLVVAGLFPEMVVAVLVVFVRP